MLPEGAAVEIAAPQGATLSLRFKFESSIRGGSLLASERNQPHAARDDVALALPVEIVEQSPLESAKGLFRDTPVPARSRAGPHVRRSARSPKRIAVTIAVAALASILLMLGALGWNISRSSGHSRQLSEAYSSLRTSIDTARELIRKGNYVEAKATLDSARELARQWPGRLDDFATEIENVAARPEIRLGATGHVLMEGQWLPAETARAWRVARERDDPTIASLRSKAEATLKSGDWESGRAACDEALAMIDAHPLKPHPQADNLSKTRELLNNRIVTKEMTAKGFVLHEEKWVTPLEKFRIEQTAKGLVEYRGTWMTKDEAFTAEQLAKGLVLHQGKWMTPEEQMEAKGFVMFEGMWVTPAERDQVLAQRREQQRLAAARAEAERQRVVRDRNNGDANRHELSSSRSTHIR
jgi:hypothetical protein